MINDYSISVVIPFYSGKEYLIQAINSIEHQTLLPNEIIVINDGSKENIDDIKSQNVSLRIIKQKNKGAASARNKGILESKGNYIAFLDSDDLWDEKKLELQINAIKKTRAVWSYHLYSKFTDKNNPVRINKKLEYKKRRIYPNITNSCRIATPSVMVKKDILIKNSFYFNEFLVAGEDTCLWYDLSERYDVTIINNKLCYVRMHGNNAAYDIKKQIIARTNIWKYIKSKKNLLSKVNLLTKFAYKLCILDTNIINSSIFNAFPSILKNTLLKIMYLTPWCIFKIMYLTSEVSKK